MFSCFLVDGLRVLAKRRSCSAIFLWTQTVLYTSNSNCSLYVELKLFFIRHTQTVLYTSNSNCCYYVYCEWPTNLVNFHGRTFYVYCERPPNLAKFHLSIYILYILFLQHRCRLLINKVSSYLSSKYCGWVDLLILHYFCTQRLHTLVKYIFMFRRVKEFFLYNYRDFYSPCYDYLLMDFSMQ